MKWLIIGTAVGGGYLWWKGGGLAAHDPLAAIRAGWNTTFDGLGVPHKPCAGCGGAGGAPAPTAGSGPQAISVGI